jgi:hypothetical protein
VRRRLLATTLLTVALLLVACAQGRGPGSGESLGTIRGSVLLAPTCPVEQVSTPCPPRPLSGVRVRVVDANGDVMASDVSDNGGRFEMDVQAGSYLLGASIDQDPARSVRPTRVQVAAGTVSHANVLVDSGIR